MESTSLGMAKVYFSAKDFGKMLKLKDESNLVVTDISVDKITSDVEVTIITPMDNCRNNRVNSIEKQSSVRHKVKLDSEEKMYIDIGRDYTIIFFNEEITKINSPNISIIIGEILRLSHSNKYIRIYSDFNNMGIALLIELKKEGFTNIADTNLSIFDENGKFKFRTIEKHSRSYVPVKHDESKI